jgi:hypothetical protein
MKNKVTADEDPLDREIDFSDGTPNPYWLGVVDRECVRLLDKDLAAIFPDDEAVNSALRAIADAARKTKPAKISARAVAARGGRR